MIRRIADVIAPDDGLRKTIQVRGHERVVRDEEGVGDEEGVHLTARGIRIATDVVTATVRSDGLLE
jgi:hypothetical protein